MPKFTTVRFGELEYNARDEIFLPDGLVGMASLKRWLILDMGEELPMKFFQSLDRGDFGFPITQPYFYHDEYEVKLSRNVRDQLGNQEADNLTTLIITTVHPGGNMVTGNLLAPLIIDAETRRGVQLTLDDEKFGIRQEINYFKFGLAVQSEASDNVAPEGQELESSAQKAEESEDHAQAKAGAASPETVGV
jgi:flagellar assembly factor FliW